MKIKIKKMLMVTLTVTIGVVALVGCGSNGNEEAVNKILEGRDGLAVAENVNLTRSISTEAEGKIQGYGNGVTANMNTREWYFTLFNDMGGESSIFSETLVLEGGTYNKTMEQTNWELMQGQENNYIFGVEDMKAIDIESKDCDEVKESKDGENTIIFVKYTKDAIKKVKEESVRNMEETMEEYKNNPMVSPEAIAINMANLDALKATNYKEMTHTFTIDKSGILIGYDSYIKIDQPEVLRAPDGKFELSEELIELCMTSKIIINSYNDEENVELIESFKDEIIK